MQPIQHILMRMGNPVISITRNHDGGTCAFAFGELASRTQVDLQLLRFSADDWTREARLTQTVLDAAPPRTPAIPRPQLAAGRARLWSGAGSRNRGTLCDC